MKSNKTLILHLEAAEPSLIEKWCDEGVLPTLQKLKENGSYCRLFSPGYIDSGCVWPTFSTGTNPGKHGMGFYHRQLQNGTYHVVKKYATDLIGEHFWDLLSQQNYKMLVMDMPLTFPKKSFNGTIVCNWGDEHASYKPSSFPHNVIDDIIRDYGHNVLNTWYQNSLLSKEEWKKLSDNILEAIKLREEIYADLLKNKEWDGAVLNFGEIHWAGHMAWHLHDKTHPEYDQDIVDYCGDIILKSYQALDTCLANLLNDLPEDTSIILLSSLGMGAQVGGEMMLDEILQKLGMVPTENAIKQGLFSKWVSKILPGKQGMSYAIQKTERVFSPKLIMFIKKFFPTKFWEKWTRRYLDIGNKRSKSLAFQVPGDHSGLIRINLKGREPKGKITKGEEYNKLCDFLIKALLDIKDSKDGTPVVKEVIKIQERISGNHVDELPDLAVIWRADKPIEVVESPLIGKIKIKEFHKRSGGHINNGFLLASGNKFNKGKKLPLHDLMDVAPTILKLFNISIPENMDGKIINDVFNISEN